ncbi:MAG: zinc ABC transporter substrate-binding protein [Gemmatimonadota bacterium]
MKFLPDFRGLPGVVLGAFLTLSACSAGGGGSEGTQDGVTVVATTGMVADMVRRVGGDRVRVTGLMGPGVDPHLYRASAGDVRLLDDASVIFYNGLHLEAAMADVLARMGDRRATWAVAESVDTTRLVRPPEFAGAWDPHIWMDPGLWASTVPGVAHALAEVDPEGREIYERNAARYVDELGELDDWVRDRLSVLRPERRVLVTAHDAFNYFGRAYDVEVRGLLGLSTVVEAGTGDVQDLARFIVERRVPAIFVESSVPDRSLRAVQAAARDRGHEVALGGTLFSDALGDPDTPEGDYVGMIRHNVDTIVDGLLPPGSEGSRVEDRGAAGS